MKALRVVNNYLASATLTLAMLIIFIMVAALFLSAATRFITGTGFAWFIELPPVLVSWLVFPLLGPLLKKGQHIKVDFLTPVLSEKSKYILFLLVNLIAFITACVFLKAGIDATSMYYNLGQVMEIEINIPIWWMFLAFPVGFFIYRGLTLKTFYESMKESGITIGVVMVMIFTVLIASRFLIFEDIPGLAEDLIYSISDNPLIIFLMLNLVMLLIGMLMDDISGIILSASLLLPIATGAGMDPIHFAAVLGVNLGMGNITPPTAPLLYLGVQVTEVPVRKLIGPTLVFIVFFEI